MLVRSTCFLYMPESKLLPSLTWSREDTDVCFRPPVCEGCRRGLVSTRNYLVSARHELSKKKVWTTSTPVLLLLALSAPTSPVSGFFRRFPVFARPGINPVRVLR